MSAVDKFKVFPEKAHVIEEMAAFEHKQWAHWMKYLFSTCTRTEDGDYVIPLGDAKRWKRQMETDYVSLSEPEKNSDREWAEGMWSIITGASDET